MSLNSLRKITAHPEHGFIMETDTDIPIPVSAGGGLLRCNVYRPLNTEQGARHPVLITLGPYGKDVPYSVFHPASFADVPQDQKSEFSAWETPEPTFWPARGYVVVRVDERGTGQSPGVLNIFSSQTNIDFKECIEWAAKQPWSNGKVGLLGISYYAITQWAVAALKPKGLICIIPWEGMNDVYRDMGRQEGIVSNSFIQPWYSRQVSSNQYGLPGKAARGWGPDTIEVSLSEIELRENEISMMSQCLKNKFTDDEYFSSRAMNLSNIEVPLLSVANWGGHTLHLRGNVRGYMQASSKNKWLYFITGRHDLPFYLSSYVALQKSFLDAWLKGEDDRGWLKGPNAPGGVPAVNISLRVGNPGFNKIAADLGFPRREEAEWPIARTKYTKFYFHPDFSISKEKSAKGSKLRYRGFDGDPLQFKTAPFTQETEVTGHIVAKLVLAIEANEEGKVPKDLDVFVTLRHLDAQGNEIYYTGTQGHPAPLTKGCLRASLRAVDSKDPRHKDYLPYKPFTRSILNYPKEEQPFEALIEVWPTNVVVSPGNRLAFEIRSQDNQGVGAYKVDHPEDRSADTFSGNNILFIGGEYDSWVQFPIIP